MLEQKHRKFLGFTVVELLVVISVIGILISIVLLVYPGYQQRARNAERKSDVGQIAAALATYAIQKNNYVGVGSGCGFNGNGNGWFNAGPAQLGAAYPRSIADCLQDIGVLKTADFIDPSGCIWDSGGNCGSYASVPAKAYMKASCQKGGIAIHYVLAYLESEPPKAAEVDALCDSGTVSGFDANGQKWGTNYGMNYYVVAK